MAEKHGSGKKAKRGKAPKAKALDLAGLIDYAPQAIVSRTLVDNAHGSITLFAFGRGQGLSEHEAPFDAVVQVVHGGTTLVIGGRKVPVKAGQMAVMPANVPHAVLGGRPFKMLLTMLRAR